MKADILTIFPGFFQGPLDHGITRRACEMGLAGSVGDANIHSDTRSSRVQPPLFGVGRLLAAELTEPINVVPSYSTVRGTCQVFRQDSIQVLRQSSSDGILVANPVDSVRLMSKSKSCASHCAME